jgi:hypothetical protein
MATGPTIHAQSAIDSPKVSSNSKTADLGLRKGQKLPSEAARSRSGEARNVLSRVAAALASMRTAVGAGPVRTTATVSPTVTARKPLITGPSPGAAQNLSGGQAPIVSSANGTSRQPPSTSEPAGARLVAAADGIQFALFGNRLVLGRANTNERGIDIDLSRLNRGAERISRRHAEIIKQGNDYFVRDLGSVNGTYIAGRGRLGRDQLYKLKDRDELVLGGAKLEFRRS